MADTAPHLRAPKPPEGSVAGNIGLAAVAHDPHIGDLVGCINMEQGSVHDGSTQVQPVAGIVVQLAVQSLNLARLVEAHLQNARASKYTSCESAMLLSFNNQYRVVHVMEETVLQLGESKGSSLAW